MKNVSSCENGAVETQLRKLRDTILHTRSLGGIFIFVPVFWSFNSMMTCGFCCWSFMCWEIAKTRYTYGISAIYRFTRYLVHGGFWLWITGILLALVVYCWFCFSLATSTERYIIRAHTPYEVSALTRLAQQWNVGGSLLFLFPASRVQ